MNEQGFDSGIGGREMRGVDDIELMENANDTIDTIDDLEIIRGFLHSVQFEPGQTSGTGLMNTSDELTVISDPANSTDSNCEDNFNPCQPQLSPSSSFSDIMIADIQFDDEININTSSSSNHLFSSESEIDYMFYRHRVVR